MNIADALIHPDVNLFDVVHNGHTFTAVTPKKPNEDNIAYLIRCAKNVQWVESRINKKSRE